MVQLVCSQAVREKLAGELAAHGVSVDHDTGGYALVERGFEVPLQGLAVVFDALDYMDVVRLIIGGLPDQRNGRLTLTGQRGTTFTLLKPREVIYFEATADGIVAHTAAGQYRVRQTLQFYEASWAAIGFIRINKSQLANVLHVNQIVPWFNSRYVLRLAGGAELEVSKTYAKRLRSALKI